jgi:hypothetical protein
MFCLWVYRLRGTKVSYDIYPQNDDEWQRLLGLIFDEEYLASQWESLAPHLRRRHSRSRVILMTATITNQGDPQPMAPLQINDNQQVTLTFAVSDDRGNADSSLTWDAAPTWTESSNGTVLTLQPSSDGTSCVAAATSTLGESTVTATGTSGGKTYSASFDLVTGASAPTTGVITAEAPVEQTQFAPTSSGTAPAPTDPTAAPAAPTDPTAAPAAPTDPTSAPTPTEPTSTAGATDPADGKLLYVHLANDAVDATAWPTASVVAGAAGGTSQTSGTAVAGGTLLYTFSGDTAGGAANGVSAGVWEVYVGPIEAPSAG